MILFTFVMSIVLVFLLYAIWSLAFPIGKTMLEFSPPIFLTGFRMLLAGTILLTYLFFRKKLPKTLPWRQTVAILCLAFFSIYLTNILEFWSLKQLPAAKTCFIYGLSPFLAALLSYFHFKEEMTPMKWLGMIIGFIGFIPVIYSSAGAGGISQIFSHVSLPEISMIFAAFFSVYGWIILRIVVKGHNISPFFANGASMFVGGLLALGTSLLADTWNPIPIVPGAVGTLFGWTLLLTFISNIVCYNLYGFLLRKYTATFLSLVGLMSPIFTSIHSWFLLGEPPSKTIIFSNFIVMFGLWLVYREELKQGYIEKDTKPTSGVDTTQN